jgi:hypothetical protein
MYALGLLALVAPTGVDPLPLPRGEAVPAPPYELRRRCCTPGNDLEGLRAGSELLRKPSCRFPVRNPLGIPMQTEC